MTDPATADLDTDPAKIAPALLPDAVPIDLLDAHPKNARRRDDRAKDALRRSLDRYGQYRAVIVRRTGDRLQLLAGHGTVEAARDLGWRSIAITDLGEVDDKQAAALLADDNRLSDLAGYDEAALLDLLRDVDDDIDRPIGYTSADIDALVSRVTMLERRQLREQRDPDDLQATPVPTHPVTTVGTVWHLGPHRLVCGDSTDTDVVARALDGRKADLLFTSPPYNVGVDYSEHDDRTTPWPPYRDLIAGTISACRPHLSDGRAVCWNIGTAPATFPHRQLVLLEDLGLTYLRTTIWRKVGVPVPLWHNTRAAGKARVFTPNYTHEVVAVFAAGDLLDTPLADLDSDDALAVWPRRRGFQPDSVHDVVAIFSTSDKLKPGRPVQFDDRLASDVFEMQQTQAGAGLRTVAGGKRTGAQTNLKTRAAKEHPAPFPVGLPEAFIVHLADVGEVVLDPYAGACSTILAAHYAGRLGAAVELGTQYCDVGAARWQRATDDVPLIERPGEAPTPYDFANPPDLDAPRRRTRKQASTSKKSAPGKAAR